MRIPVVLVALLSISSCRSSGASRSEPPSEHDAIRWSVTSLPWRPGPPTLPEGTRSVVLEGDPKKPGLFTMRLEVPSGARIAPHTHPRPERVTVLSGAVAVGFGEKEDDGKVTVFHSGDYYVNPPRVAHFVSFPESSVVQITGEGPWEIAFVK